MGKRDLIAHVERVKEACASCMSKVVLDYNRVSFRISAPKEDSKHHLRFELYYQNIDQYPEGGAVITLEDDTGFDNLAEKLNAFMETEARFPAVVQYLYEALSLPPTSSLSCAAELQVEGDGDQPELERNFSCESLLSRESSDPSIDFSSPRTPSRPPIFPPEAGDLLRKDIDEVRQHGYRAALQLAHPHAVVQLTLPMRQLNLHEETLAAWRIDPNTTLVLTATLSDYPSLAGASFKAFAAPPQRPEDVDDNAPLGWYNPSTAVPFGLEWTLNDRLKSLPALVALEAEHGLTESAAAEFMHRTAMNPARRAPAALPATLAKCACAGARVDARCRAFLGAGAGAVPAGGECPTERRNALLRIARFAHRTVVTCPRRCLICHTAVDYECIKPFVCATPPCACEFRLTDPVINAAVDLYLEIQSSPEVVDLLISVATAAAATGGKHSDLWPRRLEGWSWVTAQGHLTPNGLTVSGIDTDFEALFPELMAKQAAAAATREAKSAAERVVKKPASDAQSGLFYIEIDNQQRYEVTEITSPTSLRLATPFRRHTAAAAGGGGWAGPPPPQPFRRAQPHAIDVAALSPRERAQKMGGVLAALPAVEEMRRCGGGAALRALLDGAHPYAYALLRWLVCSCRAHLRRLGPGERIAGLPDVFDHQFVMLSAAPEKEARFRAARAAARAKRPAGGTGSIYAWHGSPADRWHSILRVGLRNLSNTPLMSVGAVFGPGIYHATNLSHSLSYSQHSVLGKWWGNSMLAGGGGPSCVALCEIVDCPDEYTSTSPYLVIPNEDWVMTRYLVLVPPSYTPSSDGGGVLASALAVPALPSIVGDRPLPPAAAAALVTAAGEWSDDDMLDEPSPISPFRSPVGPGD